MKRILFVLLCLGWQFMAFSQSYQDILSKIKTEEDAVAFIQTNSKYQPKLFKIATLNDSSLITRQIASQKSGFIFTIGQKAYKLLRVDSQLVFRASYLFLDGNQMEKSSVDSIRQLIINRYLSGTAFIELVQEYNMDGNPTGDTFWFQEGQMVKTFEDAVRNHSKGDIFMVDTPDYGWYHVVLKTQADSHSKTLVLLEITY